MTPSRQLRRIARFYPSASNCSVLPLDVVMKIAFYIPDAPDLFAYLEGLRTLRSLGDLEHLYQLGLSQRHSDLWPRLLINSSILESTLRSSYEAIAKYYVNIVVKDVNDVVWVKKHVHFMTDIEWIMTILPVTTDIANNWTDMRITRLSVGSECEAPGGWNDIFRRLPCLTSLSLLHVEGNVDTLLDVVTKSTQLTELKFFPEEFEIKATDLLCLTEWFRSQRPQVFETGFHEWDHVDETLVQDFCEAVFNCSSLKSLCLTDMYLRDVDFSHFMMKMESLQLNCCCINSDVVKSLASRLPDSKLVHLELMDSWNQATVYLEDVIQALPHSSIKTLKLLGLSLGCVNSTTFFQPIQNCHLDTLIIESSFPSTLAESLATVIQNNHTICELDLANSLISMSDLRRLVQSVTSTDRRVKTRRIKWKKYRTSSIPASDLTELEEIKIEGAFESLLCPDIDCYRFMWYST
ncbi:hypothetical protein Ae201684P_007205 [Aphanomyces euteiches]|uniref:F-box domain-containing protein n=1 Tax=Aphanomyces euteiches TaxID=100861 RepID=A0A6G0WV55_9STRA|nr:hypothetical protein Ae201684_011417 [Aphanomyces euteiches]KAH9101016.1 hypothetical protein Ae201684P_007205 [Aphanomyces euteiches]KAH9142736.1 hypothetical protein AeRB84_013210 [Aphanomyces euteiches]